MPPVRDRAGHCAGLEPAQPRLHGRLFNNCIGIALPSEDEIAAMYAIKALRLRVQQCEDELAGVERAKMSSLSTAAVTALERDALATVANLGNHCGQQPAGQPRRPNLSSSPSS